MTPPDSVAPRRMLVRLDVSSASSAAQSACGLASAPANDSPSHHLPARLGRSSPAGATARSSPEYWTDPENSRAVSKGSMSRGITHLVQHIAFTSKTKQNDQTSLNTRMDT
eukprot:scaffold652353_cov45-Prasinocladus_malaysianus.AAC.1